MRGRKPVPTNLHKLRGTFHVTRHGKGREGEPEAVGDLMSEPPDWMTDSQQSGWRYAIDNAPRGVLRRIDRGILALWVQAEDRDRTASMMQASLDAKTNLPLLLKNKAGNATVSPYVWIAMKNAVVMIKAASELGFSPASRPRLFGRTDIDEDDESPWAALQVIPGGKA
ncbi:MAG: phage terminase small subunit P27 family [Bradyrhizobium sp.]